MTTVEGMPIPLHGLPAWITVRRRNADQPMCIFTISPDANMIEYIYVDETTLEWQKSTSEQIHLPDNSVNPVHASVIEDGQTLVIANYHGPDDANQSFGASVISTPIRSSSRHCK